MRVASLDSSCTGCILINITAHCQVVHKYKASRSLLLVNFNLIVKSQVHALATIGTCVLVVSYLLLVVIFY